MRVLPPALERVCRDLEKGDAAAAQASLELARARTEECAELSVLEHVLRRRRTAPSGPWLDDFMQAWADAGRPTDFRYLGGESLDERGERLLAAAANAPHLRLGIAQFMRDEGSVSPLVLLLSVASKPGHADDCVRQALAAAEASGGKSLVDKLWIAALLDVRVESPAIADRARETLAELWADLAEARPWDFTFTANAALLPGRADSAPLTREQLEALGDAAGRHRECLELGEVYDELVSGRAARTSLGRTACFIDASVLLPNPLLGMCLRARPLLSTGPEHDREAIAAVLEAGARVFADARDASRRLIALAARKLAAEISRDPERMHAATADHQYAVRLAAAKHRFPLDWPIEPLQLEAIDASAHDEWGLFEKTVFPASANH